MARVIMWAAALLVFVMWLGNVRYADLRNRVMAYSERYQPR